MTINLAPEIHAEMAESADRRGITLTELVRRAVVLDRFIQASIEDGGRVLIEHGGERREIVLI